MALSGHMIDLAAAGTLNAKPALLGMWSKVDLKQLVAAKLVAYEREHRELDLVIFEQVGVYKSPIQLHADDATLNSAHAVFPEQHTQFLQGGASHTPTCAQLCFFSVWHPRDALSGQSISVTCP